MRKDAPGDSSGFTLIELSVALSVTAILLALAVPIFQDTLRRQRTAAALHLLTTHLAQARNTAVTRGVSVTVCPSSGNRQCRSSPDWSAGWLLYRDAKRGNQPQTPSDVLREMQHPVHASIRILSSSGRLRVRYQPDGRSGGSNLTLRVCSEDLLEAEIIVNNSGRARTRRPQPGTACTRS